MARGLPIPKITPAEADLAFAAAQCVVQTHQQIVNFIRAGQTLAQIDAEVARILRSLRCESCFRGYKLPRLPAFPSHACLSLNECIVHGTAAYTLRPIAEGDLLKVDIGVFHRGWVGDAAWTYAIRSVSDEDRRLMESGKAALREGIPTLRPGTPYLNWARAVEGRVEQRDGFRLVKGLGGHGYGRKLHGPPFISNSVPIVPGEWPEAERLAEPGILVAVEPMLTTGSGNTVQKRGEWPICTAEGARSVHYEADILISASGPRNLTEGMDALPDIVG